MKDAEPRIEMLRERHAEAEREIADLEKSPASDEMEIQEAKRRKLRIRDEIDRLRCGEP